MADMVYGNSVVDDERSIDSQWFHSASCPMERGRNAVAVAVAGTDIAEMAAVAEMAVVADIVVVVVGTVGTVVVDIVADTVGTAAAAAAAVVGVVAGTVVDGTVVVVAAADGMVPRCEEIRCRKELHRDWYCCLPPHEEELPKTG